MNHKLIHAINEALDLNMEASANLQTTELRRLSHQHNKCRGDKWIRAR